MNSPDKIFIELSNYEALVLSSMLHRFFSEGLVLKASKEEMFRDTPNIENEIVLNSIECQLENILLEPLIADHDLYMLSARKAVIDSFFGEIDR